jgi:phosphatidylglycerophosphatase A
MNQFILKWLRRIGGSVMFLGYFPVAPGTAGSALMIAAIWYANGRYPAFFDPSNALPFWILSLTLIALSVWLSNDAENVFGSHDPHQVIIDECAGQLITFLMVPLSLRTLALGFALFRFFDVLKPFPAHRFEELEGGLGITMDDVAAGVLSNISIHVIVIFYHAVRTWLS